MVSTKRWQRLLALLRLRGETVGILAVDPTSALHEMQMLTHLVCDYLLTHLKVEGSAYEPEKQMV